VDRGLRVPRLARLPGRRSGLVRRDQHVPGGPLDRRGSRRRDRSGRGLGGGRRALLQSVRDRAVAPRRPGLCRGLGPPACCSRAGVRRAGSRFAPRSGRARARVGLDVRVGSPARGAPPVVRARGGRRRRRHVPADLRQDVFQRAARRAARHARDRAGPRWVADVGRGCPRRSRARASTDLPLRAVPRVGLVAERRRHRDAPGRVARPPGGCGADRLQRGALRRSHELRLLRDGGPPGVHHADPGRPPGAAAASGEERAVVRAYRVVGAARPGPAVPGRSTGRNAHHRAAADHRRAGRHVVGLGRRIHVGAAAPHPGDPADRRRRGSVGGRTSVPCARGCMALRGRVRRERAEPHGRRRRAAGRRSTAGGRPQDRRPVPARARGGGVHDRSSLRGRGRS